MLTEKQKKLVKIAVENSGKEGSTMSKGEMLEKAGYSYGSIVNPKAIFGSRSIQRALADVARDMDEVRQKALNELKERDPKKETYKDLIKGVETMTKNHQLLTGGVTERTQSAILLHELTDDELHDYARTSISGVSEEGTLEETP